jgi:hypothetical protein
MARWVIPVLPDDATLYVTSFRLIHTETVPVLLLKGIVIQIQPRRVDDDQIGEFEDWLETVTNRFSDHLTPWLVQSKDSRFEATVTIHDKLAGVIHYDNNSDTSCHVRPMTIELSLRRNVPVNVRPACRLDGRLALTEMDVSHVGAYAAGYR